MRRKLRYYGGRLQQRVRRFKRRSIGDEGMSLSLDMEHESETLLLTFGGMKSMAGLTSFEFVNLTTGFDVKRLFVRDPRQSWYHRGLPQHSATLADLAGSLRELIAQHEVKRLVVAGNSAGGYAALLFGTLLEADVVLAFAPQTVIDAAVLAEIGDHRWDYLLLPLVRKGALEERWLDLGAALPGARRAPTRYELYYDVTLPEERAHAERLAGLEGVRMYRFGRAGHALVRSLRDCGALERILQRALDVESPDHRRGATAELDPGADGDAPVSFGTYR